MGVCQVEGLGHGRISIIVADMNSAPSCTFKSKAMGQGGGTCNACPGPCVLYWIG